jgi:ADP-ribose pyrophosphatase
MKPPLPRIALEWLGDVVTAEHEFLSLQRQQWRTRLPDGSTSRPFVYDAVRRRAMHAAVILAHFQSNRQTHVFLRSCLRPPVMLDAEDSSHVGMWELPAGLIEPGEAPAQAAARETREELGFALAPDTFRQLGPYVLPAPGMIGERQYFFTVEVDADQRGEPTLDGSPLELGGRVIAIPMDDALELAARGDLPDAKSELGLRRLKEQLRHG